MPARPLCGPDFSGEPAGQSVKALVCVAGLCAGHALRRVALQGTELAQATAGTIRLKLLKLGALVTVSVRRVKIAIASASRSKSVFATAYRRLCPEM